MRFSPPSQARAITVRPARRACGAQGRLTNGDRGQVAAGGIHRLASVLDGGEEFAHRAGKTVVEPGAVEDGPRDAGRIVQFDALGVEVGPGARGDSGRADDDGRIVRAVARSAVEDQRCLAAVESDEGRGEQGRVWPAARVAVAVTRRARVPITLSRKSNQWMPKSQGVRSSIASNGVPAIQAWSQRIATWTPVTSRGAWRPPPRAARPDAAQSARSG